MSRLYSTISGDGRAAARTRCANREVSASAQSREGSVTVSILIRENGSHLAILEVRSGESKPHGREVWRGDLAELARAESVEIVEPHPIAGGTVALLHAALGAALDYIDSDESPGARRIRSMARAAGIGASNAAVRDSDTPRGERPEVHS